MKSRCYNPQKHNHANYLAKGITVCPRWMDVENFISDMPERPSPLHTLDRIDNYKGYEPGNVRWATKSEQQNNRGVNVRVEHAGFSLTLREWERKLGKAKSAFHCRARQVGCTTAEAVVYFANRAGIKSTETETA